MKADRSVLPVAAVFGVVAMVVLLLHGIPESGAESISSGHGPTNVQPVNAVVGDAGYVAAFGVLPDASVSEDVRIESHLAYVERLLRARPVDHLAPEQVRRRMEALDHLQAYQARGEYPRNTTYPGRRVPVFIDGDGRICAVGYLIEQTTGRAAARAINDRFQFAYISDMDTPAVQRWAVQNGFTMSELSMIQPTYCGVSPTPHGCPGAEDDATNRIVGIASLGINASTALLNGWMVSRQERHRIIAGGGLLTGGAGLAIGVAGNADYSTATLVTAGASVLLSGWHLLRKPRTPEEGSGERVAGDPDVFPVWMADGLGLENAGVKVVWTF